MTAGLDRLLSPASVAVVGASESPGNRGGQAIRYLRRFGFAGAVTPVHPSGRPVHGLPSVTSLTELPGVPDVALIAVGARNVGPVVTDLGKLGVAAAVVWAGGFAEGGAEGAALQRELVATARDAGVRLLGPNSLGLVNTSTGFCGTFASWLGTVDGVLPGHISMVTQSGGLGAAAHAAAQRSGVGFRFMVSTGNEADIGVVELLEHLADDVETHVICGYLEGVDDGRRLVGAFARARANGKEVVILKGGRSKASVRAVAAHTGALAGQARIWDALLADVGAVRVSSLDELVEVSTALATNRGRPPLTGRRVAIVSYGGGSGVLAADLCVEAGLEVPPLGTATKDALRPLVPEIASLGNPVDLTPEAFNQEHYRTRSADVLAVFGAGSDVDALLLHGGTMNRGADEAAEVMCAFQRSTDKAVAIYWPGAPEAARAVFRAHGVRVFDRQQAAATTLARVVAARITTSTADDSPAPQSGLPPLPPRPPGVIGEDEVHEILRCAGVPTLDGELARTADEAVAAADRIGHPVALKVVSPDVTHRAAAGLVRLNQYGADVVRAAYADLVAAAPTGSAPVTGVYVQRMGPSGNEFIASLLDDEAFGPVVSVGAGGVVTELLDDVSFALAPLTPDAARRLVDRLRTAGYLRHKGAGAVLEPLADFLVRLSRLAEAIPWRRYVLEVNPVLVGPDGAVAADGLAIIDDLEARP